MTGLSFVGLLLTGMPIAFVLIGATFVFLFVEGRLPVLGALPQIAFGSVETFDLLAIPLFVMLGEIMNEGGLTRRIVRAARAWRASWSRWNHALRNPKARMSATNPSSTDLLVAGGKLPASPASRRTEGCRSTSSRATSAFHSASHAATPRTVSRTTFSP